MIGDPQWLRLSELWQPWAKHHADIVGKLPAVCQYHLWLATCGHDVPEDLKPRARVDFLDGKFCEVMPLYNEALAKLKGESDGKL